MDEAGISGWSLGLDQSQRELLLEIATSESSLFESWVDLNLESGKFVNPCWTTKSSSQISFMSEVFRFKFILLFLLAACNKNKLDCHEESLLGSFAKDKSIQYEVLADLDIDYFEVTSGHNKVFTLNHSGYQCDQVYDDEWSEELIFQVEGNLTNFSIRDEDLEKALCFHRQFGAWVNGRMHIIRFGIIKGEMINEDEWNINLSIELPEPNIRGEETLEFSGIFKAQ